MFKESLKFDDGSFQSIELSDLPGYDPTFTFPGDDFTCLMWFKLTNTASAKVLISAQSGATAGWTMYTDVNEKLFFKWQSTTCNSGFNLTSGEWYQAICRYDSSANKGYLHLNGVELDNLSDSNSNSNSGTNAEIGKIAHLGTSNYFDGNIGELVVWDKCLKRDICDRLYSASSNYTKISGGRTYARFEFTSSNIEDVHNGMRGSALNFDDTNPKRYVAYDHPTFAKNGVNS